VVVPGRVEHDLLDLRARDRDAAVHARSPDRLDGSAEAAATGRLDPDDVARPEPSRHLRRLLLPVHERPSGRTVGAAVRAARRPGPALGEHREAAVLEHAQLAHDAVAAAVRAHWGIENGLHWVLDTTFDEDRARNRKDHGPENLATVRKLALNVLRSARPGISIRRKRKRSAWSDDFARSVIGQMR